MEFFAWAHVVLLLFETLKNGKKKRKRLWHIGLLEYPHEWMQTYHLFYTKKLLFLFYTSIFTKHSHQSIYYTLYFI